MTTFEIKEKSLSLYQRITDLQEANLGQFVYVPEIEALYKELDELQAQCPHDYSDSNCCIICGKEK